MNNYTAPLIEFVELNKFSIYKSNNITTLGKHR